MPLLTSVNGMVGLANLLFRNPKSNPAPNPKSATRNKKSEFSSHEAKTAEYFFILRFLHRDWFWGLILILSVILAYTPIWKAGFVWDDEGILTANPCIVGPLGLKEIWTTSAADICPLTITTFWSEHALWGLAPLPYHLVNALLPRSLRDRSVARVAQSARARGMAGRSALGAASGAGRIGGVDHRIKEHRVRSIFSAIDSLLRQMASSK
jgi:hypothetical protein